MSNPLVSIIMPAYNASDYIREAIDSVLTQTYSNFELLVIDDCSTDNTCEIISSYHDNRLKLIKNDENLMVSRTKNKGIKLSQGKYIMSMDADDISYPNRFKELIDFMESNPETGICSSYVELIDSSNKSIKIREYPILDKEIRGYIFMFSPYSHGATCIRKSVLEEVGLYNYDYDYFEDRELYFRIGTKSKFANIDKPLYKLRIHSESVSAKKQKYMERGVNSLCWEYFNSKKYPGSIKIFSYLVVQKIAAYLIPTKVINFLYSKLR